MKDLLHIDRPECWPLYIGNILQKGIYSLELSCHSSYNHITNTESESKQNCRI